ncbi:unnamed protein product [Toxocara canis]|uniref:Amino acid transporter n=1 Tax=Toxocara canis TaxID=6265 RepID=A0A183UGH3_TOXCA|nr:unnamed protein product [Toxocara canis]
MLKMVILPLVAASLISSLSQLDASESGKVGFYAFLYYAITLSLSVSTGVALVLLMHPGNPRVRQYTASYSEAQQNVSTIDKFLDLIRNMFPDNIVSAAFETVQSERRVVYRSVLGGNDTQPHEHVIIEMKHLTGVNILGVIVFCIAMGIMIGRTGEHGLPLKNFFIALDVVITRIVRIIMWYAPIGVASLIAAKILEIDDVVSTVRTLASFVLCVLLGLAIHLFLTEPLVYFLASGRNPYAFMRGLVQAALTAIGTASRSTLNLHLRIPRFFSAASLPATFRCLKENNHVDPRISKFVLPIGAIVNMDGTALYEAVASIFIAQLNGIELTPSQIATISLTSTLAAIGAASIPSAGLVTMLIVLSAVGLPSNDISLIFAVDWFLFVSAPYHKNCSISAFNPIPPLFFVCHPQNIYIVEQKTIAH